uniref:Uncharacterized protein n=1 Tax=Arundo donax TaxID=35708 RepID=A0A0A9BV45_ARUDO
MDGLPLTCVSHLIDWNLWLPFSN